MNRGKRLDIQALRAIAVLSVVLYHLWPNRLTGGFMGVDIFFVISGYLMTVTIMRDLQPVLKAKNKLKATGSFLSAFYARRIKRLIPAASAVLLATLGLVIATGNLSLIVQTAKQIMTSALFVQNWQLANESVDYLANTNPTAVQHFWSLSLEEQFYLIWPLLLLSLLLVFSNLFITYKRKEIASLAIIPLALLIAGFFAYGYHLTQTNPSLAYFVTPARVWELLLGGAIAFLPALKNYDLRLLLPWVGSAMIAYALYKWDGTNFPGWHAAVPTIGTALIIYAGTLTPDSKWSFENVLRFKPIQWLGNLSYSLYLWHWPLIILLPILLFFDIDAHPQSLLIKLGILALSLVAAMLSYRYIEQTTQHIKLKKRYVYAGFVIITALVAGLAYFTSWRAERTLQASTDELRASVLSGSDPCLGAQSIINKCDESFGVIRSDYSQIAFNDKYAQLLNGGKVCSAVDGRRNNDELTTFCQVGNLESKREITIWGDSHAQHWINPMDKIGRKNNIKVNVMGTSYCLGPTTLSENCNDRFDSLKNSGVLDKSESIIVAMWHNRKYPNPGGNTLNALGTLSSLTDNPNVYLLEDIPASGDEGGPDCNVMRWTCENDIGRAVGLIEKNSRELIDMKALKPDQIISVKNMFCDDNRCYSNIGGVPVYRDQAIYRTNEGNGFNSHMTGSFAYSTWQMLEKKLKDSGAI